MKKKIILRIIFGLMILAWMYIVFGFSAQNSEESAGLSSRVAALITQNENYKETVEFIVRKIAHFTEYAIGGCLFFNFFNTFEIKNKKRIILSLLMGLIYASTDEFHQLFVDGRSGQIRDVVIDFCGVITGTLCMFGIYNCINKFKNRKIKN